MLKSHEKFYSTNGRRLVLIVDDEEINRKILGAVIEREYEVMYADNGLDALQIIKEYKDTLSLVLLDLLMPKMSGIEVLKRVREDEEIKHIPIIVVTTDQQAEVESLTLGATDFISKPYPRPDVIMARLLRTIELSEDREIISSTERDNLTGLYNKEFFFRYADQFDTFHKDQSMDAIVIDVNHFHMLNERYGREYGDEILRLIGQTVRSMIRDEDGIVCRREADAFLVYCVHGIDYEEILEKASISVEGDGDVAGTRVRLRMGVYPNVDKTIDIQRRFDRAKMAADRIRNNYSQKIAIYDNSLHETELYVEQLTGDFREAISSRQFKVFYQPKYDITEDIPVLSSAEALVRWEHPELGMISPGVFVPLFEENGMIQQLDHFVWREAAAQMLEWREKYGFTLPISVNISRVDMFEEGLVETLCTIAKENDLSPRELLLEITESAYTDDSRLIIETVNRLRKEGFRIEMDDFGTGYSSLGMISNLPIDALKLDMMFVRNAFNERKDVKMLELILDLAKHLEVPVIAEGVETREQMITLKTMGCDLVQGYFFSKPVPPEEFEPFLEERVQLEAERTAKIAHKHLAPDLEEDVLKKISTAMGSDFESIFYVDSDTGYYMQFGLQVWRDDLFLQKGGDDFFGDMERNFSVVLYPEDRDRVLNFLRREELMQRLDKETIVSMTYRLKIGGQPVYYRLQAVRAKSRHPGHIIIGIRNVSSETLRAASEEKFQAQDLEIYEMAQALTNHYETIYYVDMETDAYTVFNAGGRHDQLKIATSGVNFYEDSHHNVLNLVYPPDQQTVSEALRRENILDALEKVQSFSVDYRLMFDGQPVYYRMVCFRPELGDDHHFMIGVCNVDLEKSRESLFNDTEESRRIDSRVARALVKEYLSTYLVDVKTGRYIVYSAQEGYAQLQTSQSGEDFFGETRADVRRLVLPEDEKKALATWDEEKLMAALEEKDVVSSSYRLQIGGKPVRIVCRIYRMTEEGESHIMVTISRDDGIEQ